MSKSESEHDLFETEETKPLIDPEKDYLTELVGEGKKFTSEKDLARGKAEADITIEFMKTEMSKLREDLNKRMTIEEFLEKMNSGQDDTPGSGTHAQNDPGSQEAPKGDAARNATSTNITKDDVEKQLENFMAVKEEKERRAKNFETVQKTLKEKFGENYPSHLDALAQRLGESKDSLNELAMTRPQVFLSLINKESGNAISTDEGGVSTERFGNQGRGSRKTYKFYEDLRKSDPRTYHTARIQKELIQEAIKQGQAFYE